MPLVYEQLRATAGSFFRAERAEHTLQPTALVHEAYLKMVQGERSGWEGRAHFCAIAATAMRQILNDHARAKQAAKRGGEAGCRRRVPVTAIESPSNGATIDVLALDHALTKLAEIDPRGARIVEFRFFGGLTNEQVADLLDVSLTTVERSWRRSRAWLESELQSDEPDGAGA